MAITPLAGRRYNQIARMVIAPPAIPYFRGIGPRRSYIRQDPLSMTPHTGEEWRAVGAAGWRAAGDVRAA